MNRTQCILAITTLVSIAIIPLPMSAIGYYTCGLYCAGQECAGPAQPDSICSEYQVWGNPTCTGGTSCACDGSCFGGGGGCFDDPDCAGDPFNEEP